MAIASGCEAHQPGSSQCDAFVTIDRGFEHEHNLKKLTFGIIIIHVPKNRMEFYRPLFPALLDAVEGIKAGEIIHVRMPLAWAGSRLSTIYKDLFVLISPYSVRLSEGERQAAPGASKSNS